MDRHLFFCNLEYIYSFSILGSLKMRLMVLNSRLVEEKQNFFFFYCTLSPNSGVSFRSKLEWLLDRLEFLWTMFCEGLLFCSLMLKESKFL